MYALMKAMQKMTKSSSVTYVKLQLIKHAMVEISSINFPVMTKSGIVIGANTYSKISIFNAHKLNVSSVLT